MINETNQLSEREQEILQLVAAGLSNQQIANQLGISVNTVKVHLRKVFGKIGVASRTEATLYAVRNGLVSIERVDQLNRTTLTEATPEADASDLPGTSAAATESANVSDEPRPVAVSVVAPDAGSASDVLDRPIVAAAPVHQQSTTMLPVPAWQRSWPALLIVAVVLALMAFAMLQLLRQSGRFGTSSNDPAVAQHLVEDEQRWQQVESMDVPRAGFAAVTLGNYIYLIGGENAQGVLDIVERYDQRSATWTVLSAKPTPVTDVRAAVISGQIYVPGGRLSANSSEVTDVLERYDPASEAWESLPPLPAPRSAYAMAAVEGKLYVFGGWDGTSYRDDVFVYDPDRAQWEILPSMPTARGYMDAQVVDNIVYVIGGQHEQGKVAASEAFNPAQTNGQPWSRRAPLPAARSHFGSAAAGSLIHIIGGEGADTQPLKYNTRTDSWQRFSFPPVAVGSQPGVVLLDELILIFGGRDAQNDFSTTAQAYQALFTVFAPYEK